MPSSQPLFSWNKKCRTLSTWLTYPLKWSPLKLLDFISSKKKNKTRKNKQQLEWGHLQERKTAAITFSQTQHAGISSMYSSLKVDSVSLSQHDGRYLQGQQTWSKRNMNSQKYRNFSPKKILGQWGKRGRSKQTLVRSANVSVFRCLK